MTFNRLTTQILSLAGPARDHGRGVVRALAAQHLQSPDRAVLLVRRNLVQAAVLDLLDLDLAAVPGQAAGQDQAVEPVRAVLQLDLVREVGHVLVVQNQDPRVLQMLAVGNLVLAVLLINQGQNLQVQQNPGQAVLQNQNLEVLLLDRAAGQKPAAQLLNPDLEVQLLPNPDLEVQRLLNPDLEVRQLPGQSLGVPLNLNHALDQNRRAHPEVDLGQSPAVNLEVLPDQNLRALEEGKGPTPRGRRVRKDATVLVAVLVGRILSEQGKSTALNQMNHLQRKLIKLTFLVMIFLYLLKTRTIRMLRSR